MIRKNILKKRMDLKDKLSSYLSDRQKWKLELPSFFRELSLSQ